MNRLRNLFLEMAWVQATDQEVWSFDLHRWGSQLMMALDSNLNLYPKFLLAIGKTGILGCHTAGMPSLGWKRTSKLTP
jgi:hypothetical protein